MNIVVYDDNPDFGGHQIMACHGIAALANHPEINITAIVNPSNHQMAERLREIDNLALTPALTSTHRFQGLLNRFSFHSIDVLQRQLLRLKPDIVLCIQGDIEQSSQALLAARSANVECVSYLAIPHCAVDMGATCGALRDRTNQYLLNLPSRYITISEGMAGRLRHRGVEKPITVVPNGIHAPISPSSSRQNKPVALGMLGRIEFKQKAQDFMVQTFCNYPEVFSNCRLVIAGSGPDEHKLTRLINASSRKDDISVLPWRDDIDAFFSKIDCLVLPSRFEGVPLVMLEALVRGLPVLGSHCDGMRDILPETWTFEPMNAKALANAFSSIRNTYKEESTTLQQYVLTDMSIDKFRENFVRAVVDYTPS